MEDNLLARECKVKRCYDCNRLQDEVWNVAYEQIWPLVRQQLVRLREEPIQPAAAQSETVSKGA